MFGITTTMRCVCVQQSVPGDERARAISSHLNRTVVHTQHMHARCLDMWVLFVTAHFIPPNTFR